MAKLSSDQLAAVQQWAAAGATLNDVQQRLKSEFDITITYLDARLLLMDLQVQLKDKPKPVEPVAAARASAAPPAGAGNVTVVVDAAPSPGSLISGKVTFTDGKSAAWFIDEMGRPGMKAQEPGYQPPAADMPVFQNELDRVLMEAGF